MSETSRHPTYRSARPRPRRPASRPAGRAAATRTLLTKTAGAIERAHVLDRVARVLHPVAHRLDQGRVGAALRGDWLGHAAHPAMTDLPLGSWVSASVLDLFGGRGARPAATRLIGLGLLGAAPPAATGLVEFARLDTRHVERVAAVHALGNVACTALYAGSWLARHRGDHAQGVRLALAGAGGTAFTGFLGGYLAFSRGVGVGHRPNR